MTIFKRELTIFLRNRLFLTIFPLTIFIIALTFNKNVLDIEQIYNLYPFLFVVLIPLISSSIWQREKSLGLEGHLLLSNYHIATIIKYKFLNHYLIYFVALILELPPVLIFSGLGYVDFGQLFAINIGILLFSFFALSVTFLYSIIIKGRVLTVILSIITLLFVLFQSDMLYIFFKGIIVASDLLFYIGFSFLFIYLGIFFVGSEKKPLKLIIIFMVIILSFFIPFKFDSTLLKSHSIAPYTKEIVQNMDSEIYLSFYYSKDLIKKSSLIKETIFQLEMLNSLEKVHVLYIPDSEDKFKRDIIKYQPIRIEDKDLYSFIVVKYKNRYQVIPGIPYVETLQFEILKVIKYLKDDGLKRVGLYIGNDVFTKENFTVLNSKLKEHFFTTFIFPGESIPENLDTLIVIGHYGINDYYKEEIGHYLADGGNILIAGTGLPTDRNLNFRSTPVLESLESLGVVIEPYLVSDKNNNINSYELNVVTRPNRLLTGNSITDPFTGFIGVYLSPVLVKNESFSNLLYTSDLSWLVDSTTGLEGVPEGSFPVAAYGEGSFSTFFTVNSSAKKNRMLVLGNSMSLTNYLYTLGFESSYDFIIRSVYVLNGDNKLIDVRNRYNLDKSYYKLESNLYRKSILNIVYIFFIIIYPVFVFLLCLSIRKKS